MGEAASTKADDVALELEQAIVSGELAPGTVVGDISFEPVQRIPNIVLRKVGSWNDDGLVNFDRLHRILASEVLRDADLLAPIKDA